METLDLPDGLRVRDTARHRFVFNYAPEPQEWNGVTIPAAGVHWEERQGGLWPATSTRGKGLAG